MIRPDSPSGGDKKDVEEEIGYNCDDFYFLTDPVALVYTHLTVDPRLQVTSYSPGGVHAYRDGSLGPTTVTTERSPFCTALYNRKTYINFPR